MRWPTRPGMAATSTCARRSCTPAPDARRAIQRTGSRRCRRPPAPAPRRAAATSPAHQTPAAQGHASRQPQPTTFTILCGTTITLLTVLAGHDPRSVQSARDGLELECRRLDFVLGCGASDRKLIPPLAIYLYGNGNHIVNEQARLGLRPGLIGEQGVVSEPRPAVLGQMRQHWADHLHQQLGGLADGPIEALPRLVQGCRQGIGELVDLGHRHVETQALDVLANAVQRLVGSPAQG